MNEALNDNGTFRNSIFFTTIGESYIKIAFDAAAAADPDVKLYYNDFSIETPGKKTTAALNIVKSLQASGTKIDGVGFQSHFVVGSTPSTNVQVANLQSFTALGVEVAITELDIRMTLPSTASLLSQQSTDYKNTVAACLAVKNCVGITVWDFDDKVSSFYNSFLPSNFGSTLGCHRPFPAPDQLAFSTKTSFASRPILVLWLPLQAQVRILQTPRLKASFSKRQMERIRRLAHLRQHRQSSLRRRRRCYRRVSASQVLFWGPSS